jgi:hypothetical protein
MITEIGDARPPEAVLRVVNPVLRTLLRTPISRAMKGLALLRFDGRRSGRRFSVVVGWHVIDGVPVVLTPAPWRANFADGAAVTVRRRGRDERLVGRLETDPVTVAAAINALLAAGTSPRAIGLKLPDGHTFSPADVIATGRAMIRFVPVGGAGD